MSSLEFGVQSSEFGVMCYNIFEQAFFKAPVFVWLSCIMLRRKGIHFYLVIVLFAVYIINGLIAIPRNSVTFDEMDHWSYGKRILMMKPQKIYPYDDASAMPISGLNALPRAAEQMLHPGLVKTDGGFSDIMNGRYVTLVVCLLTGFFIYRWSKEMFGETAGLFSLFLFVFCPNLNGHGTLLTTDAYTALLTISTTYFFWRFVKYSGWKNFIAFSISLGLAQITKQTLLHLFIFLFIPSLLILVWRKTLFARFKINLLRAVALAGIVLFIINAGFFFSGTGRSLSAYNLNSKLFLTLGSSFVKNIPLPLPAPFIEGLDMAMHMNELGAGHPEVSKKNYLSGQKKEGKGFWNYYPVVFFYKTPLSVLLCLLVLLFFPLKKGMKLPHSKTILLLLAMAVYFMMLFSLISNSQVGIRHIILIYPLLYVALGAVLVYKAMKYFLPLLIIYGLFTYYKFFPNLVSYHNELVASKNVYRVMADSNIDYGQSCFRYLAFRQRNPEYKIPGSIPEAGKFIVSVDDFIDTGDKHKFDWLGKNFKPSGHFDHCYLLFDISPEDLKHLKD